MLAASQPAASSFARRQPLPGAHINFQLLITPPTATFSRPQKLPAPPSRPQQFSAAHNSAGSANSTSSDSHQQCSPCGPASWGARRGGRNVGPCHYRVLSGPSVGTTYWRPEHSAQRCYSPLDDLYPVTTAVPSLSFTLDSATEGTHGSRVRCLHSDCGGEFRSNVLARFCVEKGIKQSWTLSESPRQNGVAKRCIGLVMEIARTSMTHARAPHFLWPYVVRYAAHQLNLWPRVSRSGDSPTSLWTSLSNRPRVPSQPLGLLHGSRQAPKGRGPVVLTGHADASSVDNSATQRSSQGYTFSFGSGSVSWRSTHSSSVLSSSCEAEIYARTMAAQELRWLTYLLTDLGKQPRSPLVLYVDNKAMIALCQEHRLEHRTKRIAMRYFLARELQQRGQLRLA
ncbi:unnamed protein product [Closterium sp. NIES-54]